MQLCKGYFLRLYSSHLSNKNEVCHQDGSGRVDLESLKDGELDYGCDQAGLAELRKRTRKAVHNYEGVLTIWTHHSPHVRAVKVAVNIPLALSLSCVAQIRVFHKQSGVSFGANMTALNVTPT